MKTQIPKLFHFVFGLKEQTEPFHLAYFLCLKSCIEVNKPSAIHFYYHHEPYGDYWELIKPQLTLIEVQLESFVQDNKAYENHQEGQFIKAAKLDYAHQTDFIRLKKLIQYGGVYADMDTLFVNTIPDELYQHPFVIGREQGVTDTLTKQQRPSLCNALLMAEPNSAFAKAWLQASYESFDGTWSSHSCQQAATLAAEMPNEVYVAPQRYFYKHMWTQQGISTLFEGLDNDFEHVFSMHMWNHLWWDKSRVDFSEFHSGLINEATILAVDTTYNVIARRFLPDQASRKNIIRRILKLPEHDEPTPMKKSSSSILVPEIVDGWELSLEQSPTRFLQRTSGQFFVTNDITNMILEYCDGINSVERIIQQLLERFPNDGEDISKDVQLTLRDLALNGAIRFNQTAKQVAVTPRYSPPPVSSTQAKLCIGMATYDDYDGVYFSVQAIRLYHPEVLDDIEFVVLDNNPSGVCAEALQSLGHSMPNYRYVPGDNFQGTWSRFSLINQTNAPYILCIDSHVMIAPGAIKQLLDYFDTHPDTADFLQGPLVSDDLVSLSSHFTPGWSGGMYGQWASDPRAEDAANDAFEIPMQGLGLFALRRDNWPQVNPRFKGFGGEEGYVQEKIRRSGGRALCLPFLRWIHRFNRPMGTRYALNWEDRIRNYLIAHHELATDPNETIEHFKSHIGATETANIVARVESEIANPFYYFDAIYCINKDTAVERWNLAKQQFEALNISHRVQRLSAIETPQNHQIGRALSYRSIIQLASMNKFNNVLILEDDVVFDSNTLNNLAQSLAHLSSVDWDILYLGTGLQDNQGHRVASDEYAREVTRDDEFSAKALVVKASSYESILNGLPDNADEMARYIKLYQPSIDHHLAAVGALSQFVVEASLVNQSVAIDRNHKSS